MTSEQSMFARVGVLIFVISSRSLEKKYFLTKLSRFQNARDFARDIGPMTFCHAAKNYRIRQPPALYSNIHSARCVDGAIENRKRNIPPCELIHAPFLEKHVFFDVSKSLAHREKRIARRKFERARKNTPKSKSSNFAQTLPVDSDTSETHNLQVSSRALDWLPNCARIMTPSK